MSLLLVAAPFSACECGADLQGVPEPRIAILDAEGNSSDDAEPWLAIAFGDADSGQQVTRKLTVKNTGTGRLTISNACLVNAPDLQTAIGDAPCILTAEAPYQFPSVAGEVMPGAEVPLDVTFAPRQGGPVSLFLRFSSDAVDEPVAAVQLTGRGTDGRLCADQPVLDFGEVDVGTSSTKQVTLSNCGVKPVTIDSFQMATNPDDAFQVQIQGAAPSTPIGPLNEGETVVLDVTFTPFLAGPYRDTRAGTANLTTAQPYVGQYTLMFVGDGRSPPSCRVSVVPQTVQFGAVASGATTTRQVAIQSVGECACELTSIGEPQPAGSGFAVATQLSLPMTLKGTRGCDADPAGADQAQGIVVVDVTYTAPERPDAQADNATLEITTTDAIEPVRTVNLEANGGGAPYCELSVTPQGGGGGGLSDILSAQGRWGVVNFGRTSIHIEKRLPIAMTNTGNATCTVSNVAYDSPTNTTNNDFRLENEDGTPAQLGAASIVVEPGQTRVWNAVFAPTDLPDNGLFPSLTSGYTGGSGDTFYCVLQPRSCNGVTFTTDDARTDVSGSERPQGVFSIGFAGVPVKPDVEVIPGELDFGLVTLDCGSPERRITVYNTGTGDLVVGEPTVDPVATPPVFVITAVSNPTGTWPYTIPPGGSMSMNVRFYARAIGATTGMVIIPTVEGGAAGAPVTIALRGEGTLDSEQTDVFDQASDPKVDVLWVVDDSGSMGPFQNLLAQNFPQFFTASNIDQADYHIGVTTTLTVDSSCIPDLQGNTNCDDHDMSGHWTACSGNDRFLTPTSGDPEAQFSCNVRVSDHANVSPSRPASDSAEGGLRAAYNFLRAPKIDDPAVNGGFLRDDAKLHVIMLVDEPEQSKGPVDLYVDFFKNLKGFRNSALVAVSAIATDPGGCTLPDGTAVPDPGTRYKDVVDAMNGRFQSICASDWSTTLANLGLDSVGLQVEFFLSRAADPAALQVCVRDGSPQAPCTPSAMTSDGAADGWFYDASANSVVFNPASVPSRGSRIEVHYQAACYP